MHLLKKITVVSVAALTLLSPSLFSEGRASPYSHFHSVVLAEDSDVKDKVADSMSGLTKISSGQSLSDREKDALRDIIKEPTKYVTTERTAEYMNTLESVMKNKPNELAKELGVDATSAFTGLQSQLANWKNNSSSSGSQGAGTSLSGADIGYKALDDLKQNESYSTLYSSIVYSLSKGESADSTSISLAQMMKYPVVSSGDSRIEGSQYGSLASPAFASGPQEEGKKLATYIKTLHEYNYLVTKDKTGFSGFWNWLTGGTTKVVRVFLLNVAWVGAALYDFAMWGIAWFTEAFTKLNIIEVTGLGSAIAGTDSFLNNLLKSMFAAIGINGSLIRTIQYLFYIMIVASFLVMLVSQMRKSKSRQAVSTLKRNGLKIFTIIMTIPLTAMTYSTTGAVFKEIQLSAKDAQQITSNYVINVTDWAGTMNLSLSPISTGSIAATGEVDERFKPTTANIAKINTAIAALKSSSSNDPKVTAGQSARDQVQALISDEEATAQDYFNFIASRKTSGSGLAAEYLPQVSSTATSSGSTKTYLLVSRDKKEDVKDVVKKLLGISDDNSSSGAKESESVQPSYTYKVADKKDVTIGLESKYDLTPVVWNNPTSYLYGAIPPGNLTTSTLNHANYHLSGYTDMLNDPATGETAKDDDLSKALSENAINLALINKFAGVSQSGQMKTLSSQSVAFLLQSKLSNDTLVYKGYNTAANESGAAKNTGAYGITYVENVVPSTSITDYMSKIAGINAIWLSAGITAIAVFLALLKAPILGSIMQHLKGFVSALFTGNAIALLESVLYYLALASSFLFAYLATTIGLFLVSNLLTSTFLSYLSFIPIIGPIILSILICLLMSWPIVKLRLGVSNKQRKVGLAELLVSVPYILVESMDEYLDRFNYALYGKSKRQTFAAKMARQGEVIDQGQLVKNTLKKGVNAAVGVGRTLAGDPTGALQAAGAVVGGDNDDPNAIDKTGKRGTLGKVAAVGAGAVLGKKGADIAQKVVGAGEEILGKGDKPAGKEPGVKDSSMKETGEEVIEDLAKERSSALRTSRDEKDKDGHLEETKETHIKKSEEEIEKPQTKKEDDDETVEFDTTREDDSRLDEIVDNTGRLADKAKDKEKIDVNIEDPEIESPTIETPEINSPEIKDPKIEAPDIEIPEVNSPEIKDPKVDVSEMKDHKIETPDIEIPEVNSSEIDTSKIDTSKIEIEKANQIAGKVETDPKIDPIRTHVEKSDVVEGIKEQIENLKGGSKTVYDTVRHPVNSVKSAADFAKSKTEIVTDSSLGRNVADAIESALTGKSIEQIKVEKSTERVERDVQRETQRETVRQERLTRVQNNYERNKENFSSEALSKGLAQVQTAIQDAGRNKVVHTTAKIVQQSAKPFAMMADNILFDGEKVLGNAIKGIKPSEVEQLSSNRKPAIDTSVRRVDSVSRYDGRSAKEAEQMVDAIDELTMELRKQRPKQ